MFKYTAAVIAKVNTCAQHGSILLQHSAPVRSSALAMISLPRGKRLGAICPALQQWNSRRMVGNPRI